MRGWIWVCWTKRSLSSWQKIFPTQAKRYKSRALHPLTTCPLGSADCFTFPPAQIAAEQRFVKFSKALGDF